MDISTKTEIELKALAYDQLVMIETAQKNLTMINARLVEMQKEKDNG